MKLKYTTIDFGERQKKNANQLTMMPSIRHAVEKKENAHLMGKFITIMLL